MNLRLVVGGLVSAAALVVSLGLAGGGLVGSGGLGHGGGGLEGGGLPVIAVAAGAAAAVPSIRLPPTTGAFDYQLSGGYPPAPAVTVVTRDSTDEPAPGVYSICYINGFQTQPHVKWPSSLILHATNGRPLVDPGWPGEHLIDTSTAAKRAAAASRQARTIATCARKGFAAVEFDNLDSWTRSHGALTQADAVAFAKLLVTAAHAHGLAAAQKNTTQLASIGKTEIGFDFATAEQCDRYSECGAYTKAYGAHVLDVEYSGDLRGSFAAVCHRAATPAQTILRDRNLVPRGHSGYVYRSC